MAQVIKQDPLLSHKISPDVLKVAEHLKAYAQQQSVLLIDCQQQFLQDQANTLPNKLSFQTKLLEKQPFSSASVSSQRFRFEKIDIIWSVKKDKNIWILKAIPTTLLTLGKQLLCTNKRDNIEILRQCANINKKLALYKFVLSNGILAIEKSQSTESYNYKTNAFKRIIGQHWSKIKLQLINNLLHFIPYINYPLSQIEVISQSIKKQKISNKLTEQVKELLISSDTALKEPLSNLKTLKLMINLRKTFKNQNQKTRSSEAVIKFTQWISQMKSGVQKPESWSSIGNRNYWGIAKAFSVLNQQFNHFFCFNFNAQTALKNEIDLQRLWSNRSAQVKNIIDDKNVKEQFHDVDIVQFMANIQVLQQTTIQDYSGSHSILKLGTYNLTIFPSLYAETSSLINSGNNKNNDKIVLDLITKKPKDNEASRNSFQNQMRLLVYTRMNKNINIGSYWLEVIAQENPIRNVKPQRYYFMMQFYNNILKDINKSIIASLEVIIKILLGIINGIDFLNKRGIIHRDLKPQNICLEANLNPRLIDFGSCCAIRNCIQTRNENNESFVAKDNRLLQTKGYAIKYKSLPENSKIREKYSREQYQQHYLFDMYSFGKITQQLVLSHKNAKGKQSYLKDYLQYFVDSCCEQDPQNRLTCAQAAIYLISIYDCYKNS